MRILGRNGRGVRRIGRALQHGRRTRRPGSARRDQELQQLADDPAGLYQWEVRWRMRYRARIALKWRAADAGEDGAGRERASVTNNQRSIRASAAPGRYRLASHRARSILMVGALAARQAAWRPLRALRLYPPGPYTATISSPPMIARFFIHSIVCPVATWKASVTGMSHRNMMKAASSACHPNTSIRP